MDEVIHNRCLIVLSHFTDVQLSTLGVLFAAFEMFSLTCVN